MRGVCGEGEERGEVCVVRERQEGGVCGEGEERGGGCDAGGKVKKKNRELEDQRERERRKHCCTHVTHWNGLAPLNF